MYLVLLRRELLPWKKIIANQRFVKLREVALHEMSNFSTSQLAILTKRLRNDIHAMYKNDPKGPFAILVP